MQRDNSGTREGLLFPSLIPEEQRATGRSKAPGVGVGFRAPTNENRKRTWYRRASVISEGLRDELQAVVANHNPDGWSGWPVDKVVKRGPRAHCRKGEAGHNFGGKELCEILRDHKPYQRNSRGLRNRP